MRSFSIGMLTVFLAIEALSAQERPAAGDPTVGWLVWTTMADGSKFPDDRTYRVKGVTKDASERATWLREIETVHKWEAHSRPLTQSDYDRWKKSIKQGDQNDKRAPASKFAATKWRSDAIPGIGGYASFVQSVKSNGELWSDEIVTRENRYPPRKALTWKEISSTQIEFSQGRDTPIVYILGSDGCLRNPDGFGFVFRPIK